MEGSTNTGNYFWIYLRNYQRFAKQSFSEDWNFKFGYEGHEKQTQSKVKSIPRNRTSSLVQGVLKAGDDAEMSLYSQLASWVLKEDKSAGPEWGQICISNSGSHRLDLFCRFLTVKPRKSKWQPASEERHSWVLVHESFGKSRKNALICSRVRGDLYYAQQKTSILSVVEQSVYIPRLCGQTAVEGDTTPTFHDGLLCEHTWNNRV